MARRYGVSQSTISRNVQAALKVLELEARKIQGQWDLIGDTTILDLERKVHQLWRWNEQQPLRLEAQHWCGPWLCQPTPEGWLAGNLDCLDDQRPIDLLRKGVIDAWLASYPHTAKHDDEEIASIQLSPMPIHRLVGEGHTLLLRRDFLQAPQTQALQMTLLERLGPQAKAYPEIRLLN